MTAREMKLIALGAGAGILAAALVVGILAARELPSFAAGPTVPRPGPLWPRSLTKGRPRHRDTTRRHGSTESIGDHSRRRAGSRGPHGHIEDDIAALAAWSSRKRNFAAVSGAHRRPR